jgi:5'-nucleotidase
VRLLVTNDDGIEAEGIHVLARALRDDGHDVIVVAPDRDWSGAGASLGGIEADRNRDTERVEIPDGDGIEAWSLSGPPAFTVLAARLGAFGPEPDLVVSGINAGLNTGRAILHSGTVGAALAAQNFGISGLAVSVQPADTWHWNTAAAIAVEVLPRVMAAPERSVLNLNVPARVRADVLGIRWARLAPFGAVRATTASVQGGRVQFELTATNEELGDDTDQGLLEQGYATLTTLVGVAEAWPPVSDDDRPDPELEERIVPGAPLHDVHELPNADAVLFPPFRPDEDLSR